MTTDDYNYAVFDMAKEEPVFAEFSKSVSAGGRAPSFPLEDLATGEQVELRSLWKHGLAILEFGSFT